MMSMLNQAAVEALCSATYLENYLDCMENLPDDLQRNVSQLRELDSKSNELVSEMTSNQHTYLNETDSNIRKRALITIQRALIKSQEIGDEKLALVSQIMEHIENRTRQLEQDLENLDPGTTTANEPEESRPSNQKTATSINVKNNNKAVEPEKPEKTSSKRQRRQRTATETKEEDKKPKQLVQRSMSVDSPGPSAKTVRLVLGVDWLSKTTQKAIRQRSVTGLVVSQEEKEKPKKKKKRKAKKEKEGERSPIPEPIDPDEPTYCLCEQVSYGEMIGCDNDDCTIEWFHFNCVNLTNKPKGKWYCPRCRGDKPNVRRQEK